MISADPVDYAFFKTSICRFSPSGWYQSQLVKDTESFYLENTFKIIKSNH